MRPDRPGQALGSSRSGIPLRIVYALLRTSYALLRRLYAILRRAVTQITRSRLLAPLARRQCGRRHDRRSGLPRWAWEMRACLDRQPGALQVPISGLPIRPNEVAWFEQGLRVLGDTSLYEEEKASVILLISGYVRNSASIDADIEAAVRASGLTPDAWLASYARTLAQLADPRRFPAIARFAAAGVFQRADPPEQGFTFGLERMLDGIADLIRERA